MYIHEGYDWIASLVVCLILFILGGIPQLILHRNYYEVNKGDVLTCDTTSKVMRFIHEGREWVFSMDDIDEVMIYKTPPYNKITIWSNYNYATIKLHTGMKIIILSMMKGDDVETLIDEYKVDEYKIDVDERFFPRVYGPCVVPA